MNIPVITRLAHVFPEQILTNADLAREFPEWSIEKIYEKTGIERRYVTSENETALDLAEQACRRLMPDSSELASVDGVIFCSQSPDFILPANSSLLQARLGLNNSVFAMDIPHACSGYVYSLSVASSLIKASMLQKIIVVTAETYTKYLAHQDKSVRTIFSDAAAVTLVEARQAVEDKLFAFRFYTNGNGAKHLTLPYGARPFHSLPENLQKNYSNETRKQSNFYMNGPEVFNFTLKQVPRIIDEALVSSQLTIDDIDYVIFHQANKFMLDALQKKCRIPSGKFIIDVKDCGNTVSASIPIAMDRNIKSQLGHNKKVLLAGFGVGLSCAVCVAVI